MAGAVEIDEAGMRLGAVAGERARLGAQIDREGEPAIDHRRAVDERRLGVELVHLGIGQPRVAGAEADLVEPQPRAHQHRERARTDLGIERAGMAGGHAVELGAAIGDGAGEQVEPAGGGFGVGDRLHARGQGEALHQRDEVDAALFQHRAGAELHAVHAELVEPVGDGAIAAGKERGAHAVGHRAEAQVEAGGLHLVG